jgi:hypothetical protein
MALAIDDTLLDAMVLTGKPEEIPALVYKRFGARFDRVSSYYGWTIDDPDRMADIVAAFHSYSTTPST